MKRKEKPTIAITEAFLGMKDTPFHVRRRFRYYSFHFTGTEWILTFSQVFESKFLKYYLPYISRFIGAEHSTDFATNLQLYMYRVLDFDKFGYASIRQMHDSMTRLMPDDSYQKKVLAFGWDDYSKAIRKNPNKSKLLGTRYLGQKLLFIFLNYRKRIPLFNNWEGAPHLIISTTSTLLEKRNSGKWQSLRSIGERFLECYTTVVERLQDTENSLLRKLAGTVFKTPQTTWSHAVLAVVEGFQHDQLPRNLGDFLAFLVQAWAVASSEHSEYEIHSASFYGDLQRWAHAANQQSSTFQPGYSQAVDIFINLVWPEWNKYDILWSTPDCGSFRASLPSIELVEEKILSDPTEPELALARSLVAYLVGEHADLYRRSKVSLEAATIGATLQESWGPDLKTQSVSYNLTLGPRGSQFYIPDKHIPDEQIPNEEIFRYLACGFIFSVMVNLWTSKCS